MLRTIRSRRLSPGFRIPFDAKALRTCPRSGAGADFHRRRDRTDGDGLVSFTLGNATAFGVVAATLHQALQNLHLVITTREDPNLCRSSGRAPGTARPVPASPPP